MESLILVYVTCRDVPEALAIARHVLSERLCASANVVPIHTLYLWPPDDGVIEENAEAGVIMPTLEGLLPDLERVILEHHSYATACVLATPVSFVNKPFVRWLEGQLAR